ncbi:ribosomal-processing cysteine protease Prp [Liquorilactobacillus sicerae]|uniref:ribosomal-processing cysteine protease Prp n=1 Tax=Liquorilactobacillus sicerae TaxID=1416943 RepID=UPI00247FE631|nr:ribosomal-processing cysteine protease Prp [Liquorilactobacillus sicerae]
MIKAAFKYQGQKISGFALRGHAGSGIYGEDIVCAAVSALSINTVNSLQQLTNAHLEIQQDEANGGYLDVTVAEIDQDAVQLLLASLRLGLLDIAATYKKYLKVS